MRNQPSEKQVERISNKLYPLSTARGLDEASRYVLSLILPLVKALEEIAKWKMGESPSNTLLARNALATLKKEGIIE